MTLRVALSVAALAAASCAGPSRSTRGGARSLSGRPVGHVTVRGNRAFSDGDIVAGLAHRPPSGVPVLRWLPWFRHRTVYDPFALRVDLERIRAFYRARGYFAARADARVRAAGGAIDIAFDVDEGSPARVVSVAVDGVPDDAAAAVDRIVTASGVRRGRRFVHADYLALKAALRDALVARGYAHARVDGEVQVAVERGEVGVAIHVDAGPLVRLAPPVVTGNRRVPASVILRRVAWRAGDRYDPTRLRATQSRLGELGVFGAVRVDIPHEGRPAVVAPVLSVTEAKRHEIKLGGGAGVERDRVELRARAGYALKSLWHPLLHMRVDGKVGYLAIADATEQGRALGEGAVSFERHDFGLVRAKLTATAAFERDVFEAYTTLGPRARVAIDRPFGAGDAVRVAVAWQVTRLAIDAVDDAVAAMLDVPDDYRLGAFEQRVVVDLRDDRIVPTRGAYVELRAEEGGGFAGGAVDYLRLVPEARGYVPAGAAVIAARARVGWLRALGGGRTPLTRRFFGGGSAGHRGFGSRRLSPEVRDADGDALPGGGDALVEVSSEVRAPLPWKPFRAVAFVDGGDVTPSFDALDLGRLHWAVGIGLRIDTPVGPARIDVGYRLNRTAPAEPDGRPNPQAGRRVQFFVSLGEAF